MSVIVRLVLVSCGVLLAAASAWAQATPPGLQGFSIVLVLGDVQDGTSDSVPPAARAALGDLKDFLPYRSYRLLDTAWLLASSTTREAVTSRLRGPDEQDYTVVLDRGTGLTPTSLQMRFAMSEAGDRVEDAAHRDAQLKAELLQLAASHAALESQMRKTSDPGEQAALRQRIGEVEMAVETRRRQASYAPGGATLIDTSFMMSLGETVVVGTSRMRGGNKALIVLLTAATKGAKPRE